MHHHEPSEYGEGPPPSFLTERYPSHHVNINVASFTMEHPLTCDLGKCDLFDMALFTWDSPPAELGWWKVDENLVLSEPETRVTYRVSVEEYRT